MIYIATTTINKPTLAFKRFVKNKNCKLIVALDKKSKKFKLDGSIVLTTKFQQKKWPKLSNLVGWNCIQRRNFAILEAYERGADTIVLIDDDNIPYKNWFTNILVNKSVKAKFLTINKNAFDPIGFTNYKFLWHRGYPLEMVKNRKYTFKGVKKITADIQASFWNGDPDIDAIARIIYKPKCKFKKKYFPFFSDKISPFNSQNTLISKRIVNDYFLFPHVGRMDDIWASYYVTSKKYKVIYAQPTVFQKRNMHKFIKDFKQEILGYYNNDRLVNELYKSSDNIYKFLPKKSSQAFDEWKKIIYKLKK